MATLMQELDGQVSTRDAREGARNEPIFFVNKQYVSKHRQDDVTHSHIICYYQEGKAEPNRTRLTVRGDRINYPVDCRTSTANLLTIKLLLTASYPYRFKFLTMDIKIFYLNTPLKRYKYLQLKLVDTPQDGAEQYDN